MKIKKVLTQQLNVLSLPEIRIEAKVMIWGWKESILFWVGFYILMKNRFIIIFRKICSFMKMGRSRGAFSLPTTV